MHVGIFCCLWFISGIDINIVFVFTVVDITNILTAFTSHDVNTALYSNVVSLINFVFTKRISLESLPRWYYLRDSDSLHIYFRLFILCLYLYVHIRRDLDANLFWLNFSKILRHKKWMFSIVHWLQNIHRK